VDGGVLEVKLGYKLTEAGVIPRDWEVRSIGQMFQLVNGVAFTPEQWKQSGTPIIRIQNLNDPYATFNYSQVPIAERNRVEPGDLLFAWSGTIGTSFGARIWAGPSGVLNQHIFKVHMDQQQITLPFSLLVFARVEEAIAKQAHGFKASFVHVKKSDLVKVSLPVPPLPEQRAIAAMLSDVDALLGGLNGLIAKKRDLKKAAMQQLLTGQTRLPGFHGKWECGNIASVIGALDAGVSVNSVEHDDGDGFDGMFILKTSAVAGGRFIPRECKRIAQKDLSRACLNPQKGMIIISRMNTPDLVGECGYVDRDYPNLFVPDRLWMTRFKQDLQVSGLWLSYLLSTAALKRQIAAAATGTSGSMKNLSKQTFLQIPISLPSCREQSDIAAVLFDMDAEVAALEARRDKTRWLKQGMMQELLTGKTRVVPAGAAHA
jgi:type I restriction enzyme S subunit